jgi:hypothetical protein
MEIEPMNLRNTIAAINQMQADGVIERYAIGGAVPANPGAPRTRRVCSSSSKPGRSTPNDFRVSFPVTV